ncbi:putative inorganic phosphate cotransporter [Pectinophora gossypiella]|uniref:putative inorganic phosphate cotransporter n=1 Tax=Pectinophora gossypiella TaxID=13191 RepID=UPI00214DFFCA|nr:putative inorganic phosphate cotransporter [Pectinophora gossypiella]
MTNEKVENNIEDEPKPSYGCGLRHVQTLLLFLAMMLAFAMRANISVAIVAMTDDTKDDTFDWSMQTQSVILSSFFWGYIVLQIPAGVLSAKFGGKQLVTIVIAVNSVVSLILPLGAYYGGWQLVCGCRILQGLSQGLLNPSMHSLIGKWVPLEEKSRLGTFIYAGQQFGTAIQLMISGFIAEAWGWPAIFYVNGACGAIWLAVYVFIGANSPQHSKMISEKERHYIQSSLGHVGEQKKIQTPWKSMFTSIPFLSLIIVHCGQNWGFWTLMTEMPSYMSQVLGVNIKANGVMSALPYLAMVVLSIPFGFLADLAIKKNWLSITAVRKVSNSIGHYGPALALIGLTYAPAGNVTVAVLLLTMVVGLNAGTYTGYLLVHIDMAPNFGGTMMGITNFFANIISIIAPLTAGALLHDETQASEWRKVFYLSSAIYIICNTVYVIFGTSVKQTWNDVPEIEEDRTDPEAQKKNEQ